MSNALLQAIFAAADATATADDWIHLCCTAADEATSAVSHGELTEEQWADLEALMRQEPPPAIEWLLSELGNADEGPATLHFPPFYPRAMIESALRRRLTTRQESAVRAALHRGGDRSVSLEAAALAFAANLPALTSRRNTQAFIACVAVGMARGYFTGKAASTLLYAAQSALSAFPKRKRHAA